MKEQRDVYPVLARMLAERVRVGEERYGTRLTTNNDRSALRDAWEEAVDLTFYLTQALMEEEERKK
jgi:hypothetical protein